MTAQVYKRLVSTIFIIKTYFKFLRFVLKVGCLHISSTHEIDSFRKFAVPCIWQS